MLSDYVLVIGVAVVLSTPLALFGVHVWTYDVIVAIIVPIVTELHSGTRLQFL